MKKRNKKIRVAILFGGKSAEHEVSLQSAKNVYEAIDKDKYDIVLVGIDKRGRWLLNSIDTNVLLNSANPQLLKLSKGGMEIAVVQGAGNKSLVSLAAKAPIGPVDVVFPVLHGPFGEDGTVQGLLKLADVPFVGAGVLGSAIGTDKDVQKRLLRDAGIPVGKFAAFGREDLTGVSYEDLVKQFGVPFFVKPANLGSSVGINKVKNKKQFQEATKEAFSYDRKILVEEYIKGRELECSVLGNESLIASLPGEVLPQHEFYSYEAKYIDENGAILKIPAELPAAVAKSVQEIAVKTFKVLCCEGMARVDFFLGKDGKIFVNEINTIPGFTAISMYPKLWEASGMPYGELVDRLIELAIGRFKKEKKLRTTYKS